MCPLESPRGLSTGFGTDERMERGLGDTKTQLSHLCSAIAGTTITKRSAGFPKSVSIPVRGGSPIPVAQD
jgi:hypothetical protein